MVHPDPVWGCRANFIIAARIIDKDYPGWEYEQLWARQLDHNRFEICCIPFFVYDLALGDEVETAQHGDRRYVVSHVVAPSGRYAFRVWFEDEATRQELPQEIEKIGGLMEWWYPTSNFLAIDVATHEQAQRVANVLFEKEQRALLDYETSR